ncbi:hypothetical protein I4U23_015624 [Adineta vaga]|nr:hypothetical protein I4U23_015624 [Adineta vaga]
MKFIFLSRSMNEKFHPGIYKLIRSFKRLCICLIVFLLIYSLYRFTINQISLVLSPQSQGNFLDGCRFVYIDMGTNIGIQIRKLYEPQLYPNSTISPLFARMFGTYTKQVCSVGFEANPVHDVYLKMFENYCLRNKYRVKIFTSTAVSITNESQAFYTQPNDTLYHQWGSSLQPNANKTKIMVSSIDIASWIKGTVLTRKIPSGLPAPKIMIKTDIEGHDSIVLTNLIFSGVYCSIDLIYGEHFNQEFQNAVSVLKQYTNSCRTELVLLDDETYHVVKIPFF